MPPPVSEELAWLGDHAESVKERETTREVFRRYRTWKLEWIRIMQSNSRFGCGAPACSRLWSLDILRAGLSSTLDPTLSRSPGSGGLAELKGLTMFSLEKRKVYDRALATVASLAQLSARWDKRHAVVD